MGLVLPGAAKSIADRVQQGDPIAGWRGDPTMDVYLDDRRQVAEVWHFDRGGHRYCAAQTTLLEDGWEHTLLRKLRDGDWQNPDTIPNIVAMQDANERRHAAQRAEWAGARADRVIYEYRKALGTHIGGLRRRYYPVS